MGKRGDSIIGDVNGQIGDKIYKRKGKKKIVVQKGEKVNHHTPARLRTEGLFEELPKIWKSLKRSEKKTWLALLKRGTTFKSSKYNKIVDPMMLFISINRNLQEANEPILLEAPYEALFPQIIIGIKFDVILNKRGGDILMYLPIKIQDDTKVILYATPVLTNPTDPPDWRLYRKIGVEDSCFKTGTSIREMYLKVFKNMPEERDEISIRYKTVHRNHGTASLAMHDVVMAHKLDEPLKNQPKSGKEPAANQLRTSKEPD